MMLASRIHLGPFFGFVTAGFLMELGCGNYSGVSPMTVQTWVEDVPHLSVAAKWGFGVHD
jgi:hypothetical protein